MEFRKSCAFHMNATHNRCHTRASIIEQIQSNQHKTSGKEFRVGQLRTGLETNEAGTALDWVLRPGTRRSTDEITQNANESRCSGEISVVAVKLDLFRGQFYSDPGISSDVFILRKVSLCSQSLHFNKLLSLLQHGFDKQTLTFVSFIVSATS